MTNKKTTKQIIDDALKEVASGGAQHAYLSKEEQEKVTRNLHQISALVGKELEKLVGKPVPFAIFAWGGYRTQFISNVEPGLVVNAVDPAIEAVRKHVETNSKTQH